MSEPAPVALVTGGSRGLGRGICCQLAQGGFSVIINYAINVAAAGQASSLCEQVRKDDSQKFLPIQGDISSRDDRRNLLDRAMQEFGRIDVLVNNAGIAPSERADIIEAKEESFEMLIRTNLQGPYFL
ncbi:MAG TPA: SDR family NAD(P)-dependent oxidoreductase, partial [Spirochaetia bacterium]|nr:SDR family NAD(P)-dependent oxidoreductase [Spirochaetia bacterium]